MSEYNWRKEREKYRPAFQQTEEKAAETPVQTATMFSRSKIFIAAGCLFAAAVILLGVFALKGKESSAQFTEIVEKHKTAVGLVALTVELENGKKVTIPIGTAWALSPNRFATNGHVAVGLKGTLQEFIKNNVTALLAAEAEKNGSKSLKEFLDKLGNQQDTVIESTAKKVFASIKNVRGDIIINGTRNKSYPITFVQIHKNYGAVNTQFNPDVAVLTIDGKHDNFFKLADKSTLYSLKSGVPVAFLGFPMENLDKSNVNVDNPIASMQSGIVVAVSDFEMKDAGRDGNFLLRHNLPATGGASGSPIFNRNGEVVALLYAINIVGQVQSNGSNTVITRAPSGVQINFGVRADLLEGLGNAVAFNEFMK